MRKVGIVGGAGYTGGELIRLLNGHPDIELIFASSRSQAGKPFSSVHHDLFQSDDTFTSQIHFDLDAIFICAGHGQGQAFMAENEVPATIKVIDLSHDFRLAGDHPFIYGLPELNRAHIANAHRIANPGCFATCLQLALLPAAKHRALGPALNIHAITGSTGAGQSPSATGHFSWRNNNISVYKAFNHQHLAEIKQSLLQMDPQFSSDIHFIPVRGNFTRGIFASIYWHSTWSESEVVDMYDNFYHDHPFVTLTTSNPNLKSVVNTNHCLLHIKKYNDQIHIISIIDNLVKGASGQALQNYNIMEGLGEDTGLQLKGSYF